jgi:hypothetical protein
MTDNTKISRRHLLALTGAASATFLAQRPVSGEEPRVSPKLLGQQRQVIIRDVQVASIQDEYVCHLVKITTNTELYGLGEARPKQVSIPKHINNYKEAIIGEDPLRLDYLRAKMVAAG